MVSNEVIIAAIGAATTIICAILAYMTNRIRHVTKLVNSAAATLAAQTAANTAAALAQTRSDTIVALERSDKLVAEAKEGK